MSKIIVGAGTAGLLAARMLQRHDPIVLEAQPSLPHNHSAVLRFSTNKVAEVLGIPFKKVQMVKTVVPWRNPVADAIAYSNKVTDEYRTDRSIVLPERWSSVERYIAPPDLIERMAEGVRIEFGCDYDFREGVAKVISTIPMPTLARKMGHRDLGWQWISGVNIRAKLRRTEAYATVMVPDPGVPFSRASITGDELIVETSHQALVREQDAEGIVNEALYFLGITLKVYDEDDVEVITQPYSKIVPIDEGDRRNFIFWASVVKGRAFQLGRYATWRPRLLLDDLVHDVRLIESWMMSKSPEYDMEEHERRSA